MQGLPHPSVSRALPVSLERLVRLRAAHAWIVILLCADLAALGDLVTGPEVWFGPAYLFVVCLAAWCLGSRAGYVTGLGSLFLTFTVNGLALYPLGSADVAWNAAVRFIALSIVIALIGGARQAYIREWWLARTDPLTGALNRQAFFELGEQVTKGRGWHLLIYADLDGLKQINDLHGHASGDRILQAFSEAVRRDIRRDDMFARLGGDEFVILMPVKDRMAAQGVAGRLHQRMNSIQAGNGSSLRCSVGALIIPQGAMHIDDLVRQTDNLMYQAKLRGASLQVEVASKAAAGVTTGRARTSDRSSFSGSSVAKAPRVDRRIGAGAISSSRKRWRRATLEA